MAEEYYEPTAENEAAEQAAFENAYTNGSDVETPEAVELNEPTTETETPETREEPPVQTAQPITIDDLKAAMEAREAENQRKLDRVFGKIGDLQQKIDTARTAYSGISPKARERLLSADFPELAEMLFEGVEQAPEPVYQAHAETQAPAVDLERKLERRLLSRDHKDWEQVVTSPEFATWKDTVLPFAESQTLNDSWDADFVSGKIAQFKAWNAANAAKTVSTKNRLESAITPRGIPGASSHADDDSEEQWMMKSYKQR